ncbi:MAG: abortive infection family protein [Methylococcaceae bacterium]
MLKEFKHDIEIAEALQNIAISIATGKSKDEDEQVYKELRNYFIKNQKYNELLPSFIRTSRDLSQFWQFIKVKFSSYSERRQYIWQEFLPLLDFLENKGTRPVDANTSKLLKAFDEQNVHAVWQKALDRRTTDPEGAITTARSLLETVCKHILDDKGIPYSKNIELHELYKLTSNELNISPSQHTEDIFKQILGGCSAIVNGLGTLRNRLGDAHGTGKNPIKPAPRHAELAVNIAGSMALFFLSTWLEKK